MPSPKRLLMEHLYDGDLAADVAAHLTAGTSWREIAERVSARTGVTVSYESLRQWFGPQQDAA